MKKIFTLFIICIAMWGFSQSITLSRVEKYSENNDRFLYKISENQKDAQYLGEVEVQGYSNDDVNVFREIYKKAKTTGANSFRLKKSESIEGGFVVFNPAHYYLNLYYTPEIEKENNVVYIISSEEKPIKIKVDNKIKTLPPRAFYKLELQPMVKHSVVAGGFLGSKITLGYKDAQPVQYFQILSGGVSTEQTGDGGLKLKSGDIVSLEKSYAEFLTIIYKELKEL